MTLVSCGGSKLSLEEAEQVTLNYQGENYTPPPRGVDKLIEEIKLSGEGLVQNYVCKKCEFMDPEDDDVLIRIQNLKMKLNNRRVLMFATHALLPGDLDGLVQPAIALKAPAAAKATAGNDGLLTMSEVMGLNLNADWVVLSPCLLGPVYRCG